jgi:hypothetical protein
MIDRDLGRLRRRFVQDTNAKVVSVLQAKPGNVVCGGERR